MQINMDARAWSIVKKNRLPRLACYVVWPGATAGRNAMAIPGAIVRNRDDSVRTGTAHPSPDLPASAGLVAPEGDGCDVCLLRATCLGRFFQAAIADAERLVGHHRAVAQQQVLYRAGAKCSSVYVVQAGFYKTLTLSEDGIAQVTGFPMPGDLLGMDGLSSGIYRSDAVALSQGSVCVIPRARLLHSSGGDEVLCRHLLGLLSDEIASDHNTMLLLGSRGADERVAEFIVDLSERLSGRGYSSSDIGLWMTREEIGSFLGLELETISRILSRFRQRGLLDIHRRHLHIRNLDGLRQVVAGHEARAQGRRRATPFERR
jgi:CRP/FNR family transcriptional regulator